MTMESGYEKADSSNLPVIDVQMINEYFATNAQYFSSEMKNIKAERATRENYGDEAIGYVQLKRVHPHCTIKLKITPEHRVHEKGYSVTIVIDEEQESVRQCECHDCSASAGGCKHAIASLLWLHRRSEEPSVTSVQCYWRTSRLSKIGRIEPLTLEDISKNKTVSLLREKDDSFRKKYEERAIERGSKSILASILVDNPIKKVSIHCLHIEFCEKSTADEQTAENFIQYMINNITLQNCREVDDLTVLQSKSSQWYQVRFGRITASKIFEVSRCQTVDSVLVENIFGATEIPLTDAVQRGRQLESAVLSKISKLKKITVRNSGFIIDPQYPVFGASPDGLSKDYCIEIKCPSKDKTVRNYINEDGKISNKPYAQLQMQMFLSGKKQGLFCVASPNFENDSDVQIVEVNLDESFCKNIMSKSLEFWKIAIYSKLCK